MWVRRGGVVCGVAQRAFVSNRLQGFLQARFFVFRFVCPERAVCLAPVTVEFVREYCLGRLFAVED